MIQFPDVRLIDPGTLTDFHGSLTVDGGVIQSINAPAPKTGTIIDCLGLPHAPGIVAMTTTQPISVAV